MKKKGKYRKRQNSKRWKGPAAAALAAAVCCWTGLVKVDRQIRAVTINCSPPLWEAREEGDTLRLTLLGRGVALDLGPVKAAGRALGEEAAQVLRTPAAPERAWRMIREGAVGSGAR